MEHLFLIKEPVLVLLTAVFFVLMVGQTLHLLIVSTQKDVRPLVPTLVYEFLLVVHLILACSTASAAMQNHGEILIRLKALTFSLEPFLWINGFTACWGLALALRGKKAHMIPELIIVAACTPACIALLGSWSWVLLSIDAGCFLVRIGVTLVFDIRHQLINISRLSLIDAVNHLPEGFLCSNKRGNVLIMNDSMRACLVALGFTTDHIKAHTLWNNLEARARASMNPVNTVLPSGIRLQISPFEIRLFTREPIRLHHQSSECIIALDVTEEEKLNADIERTNKLLFSANKELECSITQVQKVAQNEALIAMKSRVHDVIGQRLSILHRYLEDENTSLTSLQEIISLLNHVIDDLNKTEQLDKQAELDSIIEAFSLIDVTIETKGALPQNEDIAEAYVRIIREAATNAVKHARANIVSLLFEERANTYLLTISNNGLVPKKHIQEGSGLPSMRNTAQSLGGSFSLSSDKKPFTIKVVIPKKGETT